MGLDQYLYKSRPSKENNKDPVEEHAVELAYWRKHPNLQGYMEELWLSKHNDGVFNCVNVVLTKEDLYQWKKDCEAGRYPKTTGFLFGSDSDKEYKDYDLETIHKALKAIDEGWVIFYSSWW